jgi:hypothetical protein
VYEISYIPRLLYTRSSREKSRGPISTERSTDRTNERSTLLVAREGHKQREGEFAELKSAVAFLSEKVNAAIIANEPSSKVITNKNDVPKAIQFTTINNSATAEIVKKC